MVEDLVSFVFVNCLLLSNPWNPLLFFFGFIVWLDFSLRVNPGYKSLFLDSLLNVLLTHANDSVIELIVGFIFGNDIMRMKDPYLPPNDHKILVGIVSKVEDSLIFLELLNLKRISDHPTFTFIKLAIWLRSVMLSFNVFNVLFHKFEVLNQRY